MSNQFDDPTLPRSGKGCECGNSRRRKVSSFKWTLFNYPHSNWITLIVIFYLVRFCIYWSRKCTLYLVEWLPSPTDYALTTSEDSAVMQPTFAEP